MSATLTFVLDSGETPTPHGFTGLNPGLLARLRKVATTLAIITILLTLVANSPATSSAGESRSPLEAAAHAYFQCMYDAHLPVIIEQNFQDEWAVVHFSGDMTTMWRNQHGAAHGFPSTADARNPTISKQLSDFTLSPRRDLTLIIDGENHSDTYARCLRLSGYDEYAAWGTAPDLVELSQKTQRMVTANNKWAACARANGWPMVKDSTMPANPVFERPQVRLPISITELELRQLLDRCPNFDPVMHQIYDFWWAFHPDDDPSAYLPDPDIDFDAWSYTFTLIPGFLSTHEQATIDKLRALHMILDESWTQYYRQLVDADGVYRITIGEVEAGIQFPEFSMTTPR